MDGIGQVVSIEDVDDMGGQCFVYIRLSVHGIHLTSSSGSANSEAKTGSVSVGDTFIFSPTILPTASSLSIAATSTGEELTQIAQSVSMTDRVPYFHSFVAPGAEDIAARRLLSVMNSNHMLSTLELGKVIDMLMYCFFLLIVFINCLCVSFFSFHDI